MKNTIPTKTASYHIHSSTSQTTFFYYYYFFLKVAGRLIHQTEYIKVKEKKTLMVNIIYNVIRSDQMPVKHLRLSTHNMQLL